MKLDNLTVKTREAITAAHAEAERRAHLELTPEHVLAALLNQDNGTATALLQKTGIDPTPVVEAVAQALDGLPVGRGGTDVSPSPKFKSLVAEANNQAKVFKDEYVASEHILLALVAKELGSGSRVLKEQGLTQERLMTALAEVRGQQRVTDPEAEDRYQSLAKYTRDLTTLAQSGKLDPVVGRDEEVRRSMQVLSRRTKNNPVLIGEPGLAKPLLWKALPNASPLVMCRSRSKTKRFYHWTWARSLQVANTGGNSKTA